MKTVQTVIDRYTAAVESLDADAMLALYAPDARIFDMVMPWEHRSAESFRALVEQWFNMTGANPTVKFNDVSIVEADAIAVLTAIVDYLDDGKNGERNCMSNRLTWVLQPGGDELLITHEHTSAPLSDEDEAMPPVFQR